MSPDRYLVLAVDGTASRGWSLLGSFRDDVVAMAIAGDSVASGRWAGSLVVDREAGRVLVWYGIAAGSVTA